MKPVILIVDNEKNQREGLKKAFAPSDYMILLSPGAEEALRILDQRQVDVLLTDLKMPGINGLELMRRALKLRPDMIVILLTAYGTVQTAVEAMKEGAYDFLTKPINLDRLEMVVRRALTARAVERENIRLREQLGERYSIGNIIGQSKEIEDVLGAIRQIAPTTATVLIEGESGTGKELVARAIHGLSKRREHPFVAVHCAALAKELLESELFGHERGAFTGAVKRHTGRFEMADNGTLFLDEVSEMPPETQVKLLRVLQEQEFERVGGTETIRVNVRLITATNADLEKLMIEGKFREDLYYRLNVVRLTIPPLRERREDITPLINFFLKEFNAVNGKSIKEFTPVALDTLVSYDWPGNVRELRNCVEVAVILSRNNIIDLPDLPLKIREGVAKPLPEARGIAAVAKTPVTPGGETTIRAMEKQIIEDVLRKTGGKRTEAAALLGISRRTLHRKIIKYGIEITPSQPASQ